MNLRWTLGATVFSLFCSAACGGSIDGGPPPEVAPPLPYDALAAGDSCVQIDIYPDAPSAATETERPPSNVIDAAPRAAHTCAPGHLLDCTEQCRRGDP